MRDGGNGDSSETASVAKTGKQKIDDRYWCQSHPEESNNNLVK